MSVRGGLRKLLGSLDPELVSNVVITIVATGLAVYLGHSLSAQFLDGPSRSKESKRKTNTTLQRLCKDYPGIEKSLDEYEKSIIANVVTPSEIKTSFTDIGGLDDIVDELKESVLYPLTVPSLYSHSPLLAAPKGVLLYGPPGCGKTMLAKALAAESGANFISIRMSQVLDKYLGESNKLVAAIFSLANKLQPCIIFIDEIDSFLRDRQSTDHEVSAMIKAEFMTLWDGLGTAENSRVLVLGATNRPADIDDAFLRRMPKRFAVGLPNEDQRRKILQILLKDSKLDDEKFSLDVIAKETVGMSGSDIKETCRTAAMTAMREFIRSRGTQGIQPGETVEIRPLVNEDFLLHIPRYVARKERESLVE